MGVFGNTTKLNKSFQKKVGNGEKFDLEDYGTIIECANGEDPPEDMIKKMETQYAVGSDFGKALLERVSALEEGR